MSRNSVGEVGGENKWREAVKEGSGGNNGGRYWGEEGKVVRETSWGG